MRCGLLGNKLSHSYSPQIHGYLASYSYDLFERNKEELESFLRTGNFDGLNVTIPYKKAVLPYCDELSERALQLGAVNTIVRRLDGTLIGHNSDYFGFLSMVENCGLQMFHKKVLVLGSGGASATVAAVLQDLQANVIIISRSGENNYNNLHKHMDAAVIVNTTPVGMYPNNGASPIDLDYFPDLECVLDVIYNPARTQLLMDAAAKGIKTENGLLMLVAQAKESAEWFTGSKISNEKIIEIHNQLSKQMENIILIGMPGCGKTTIGQMLAKYLDHKFVDSDDEIVRVTGMSIPEIFEKYGESGFRKFEGMILQKLCKESGLVIATGGGCVTQNSNYDILHQNGRIIWIKRDISLLPTVGRPLSQANKLEVMYSVRKSMYESFADYSIYNNQTLDFALNQILTKENM